MAFCHILISTCTYVNNIRYFSQEYLPELWKYRKTKQTHLNETHDEWKRSLN